jgi:hypothetical protein
MACAASIALTNRLLRLLLLLLLELPFPAAYDSGFHEASSFGSSSKRRTRGRVTVCLGDCVELCSGIERSCVSSPHASTGFLRVEYIILDTKVEKEEKKYSVNETKQVNRKKG